MTNPNHLVIIAAVVDVHNLTLYKEDGSTVLIPQGDTRLQPILNVALAGLKKLGDKVTVDLSEATPYADFEKKTGGLVKLFRVAKSKVAEFFGKTEAEPVKPITLGIIPTAKDVPAMTAVVTKRPARDENGEIITPLASAVAEIMVNAVPVSSSDFAEPVAAHEDDEPDTLIAVVGGQVIPDVAALKPQMAAAVLRPDATTKGTENFLARLAKVISKRRHSVEDLMKFMQKGDLPIADDGSIVIYKILKKHRTLADTFVDCHSGNVPQKVGSYVHMTENMVDPDRRNECSNGLHVARRGYLGAFSGDVCVLAKVAPEDVIAVPEYDANKMRVCGYHILALLSQETFKTLRANEPMTNNPADKALLGAVLAGEHIGVLEKVHIGGQKGSNVTITKVGNPDAPVKVASGIVKEAEALPENGQLAPSVDVKEVAKEVTKAKEQVFQAPPAGMHVTGAITGPVATPPPLPPSKDGMTDVDVRKHFNMDKPEAKPVKKLSLKDQAGNLFAQMMASVTLDGKQVLAAQLVTLKKSSKKSWEALGISASNADAVQNIAAPALPQKGAIFTNEATIAKAEAKVRKPRSDKGSKVGLVQDVNTGELEVVTKPKPSRVVNGVETGLGTPKQRIRKLLSVGLTSVGVATAIVTLKKASKKSWTSLAVTDWEVEQIMKLYDRK